jgi:carboxylesterase
LRRFQSVVRADLAKVTQPLLLLHSAQDHVVEPVNSAMVLAGISSTDVREVVLQESYHVATLDHDAPLIFDATVEFIQRLSHRP